MKIDLRGFVFLLLLTYHLSSAQQQNWDITDLAKNLVKRTTTKTQVAEAITESINKGLISPDSAASYYMSLALVVKQSHDFTTSRYLCQQALNLIKSNVNQPLEAKVLMLLGDMAMEEDDIAEALEVQSKALKIYEEQGDSINYLHTLRKIGVAYDYFGDHESARQYYDDCIRLAEKLNRPDVIGNCYNTIAAIYNQEGQYREAIVYFEKGVKIAESVGDQILLGKLTHNMSSAYQKLGLFDEAKIHLNRSMKISREIKNQKSIGFGYQGFGFLYFRSGQLDSSEFYMNKTLSLGSKINNQQLVGNAHEILGEIYEKQERYKEAFFNLKHIKAQDDSLFNENNSALIQSIRGKYETAEKERELAETNLKLQEADFKLNAQQNLQTALIIGLALTFLIVFLLYRGAQLNKKTNIMLTAKNEEIERLNTTKSRWFVNVAHELRTPLTLIKGPINRVMSQFDLPDEAQNDLKLVDRNAANLSALVSEILDLSRMESGEISLIESEFNFSELVEQVFNSYKTKAVHEGLHFSHGCRVDKCILGDRAKLQKVISNLIGNAFKFTDPGGSVEVKVEFEDKLCVDVTDTGIGIREEDLPRVFDRFYQIADGNEQMNGGTGIGLAICKEIVTMHQGTINVRSSQGKGSTFSVCLPQERVI